MPRNELTTHFFQVVVYPKERPLFEQDLQRAGVLWVSPLHTPDGDKKIHYHVIIRYERKTTANVFMGVLVDILSNDFTGIAVCLEKLAVGELTSVLRYDLHRDIPYKEQFELEEVFADTNQTFAPHVAKAFDGEIRAIVTDRIERFIVLDCLEVAYMFGRDNFVLQNWLVQGKNTQYTYNLIVAQKGQGARYVKQSRNND